MQKTKLFAAILCMAGLSPMAFGTDHGGESPETVKTENPKSPSGSAEEYRKQFCEWFTRVEMQTPKEIARQKNQARHLQKKYNQTADDLCAALNSSLSKILDLLPDETDSQSWPGKSQFNKFYARSCHKGSATRDLKNRLNQSQDTWEESDTVLEEIRIFMSMAGNQLNPQLGFTKEESQRFRKVMKDMPRWGYVPNPGLNPQYLQHFANEARFRRDLACSPLTSRDPAKYHQMIMIGARLATDAFDRAKTMKEVNSVSRENGELVRAAQGVSPEAMYSSCKIPEHWVSPLVRAVAGGDFENKEIPKETMNSLDPRCADDIRFAIEQGNSLDEITHSIRSQHGY